MSLRALKSACLLLSLCGFAGIPDQLQAQPLIFPPRDRSFGSQPEFHLTRRLPRNSETQTLLQTATDAIADGEIVEGLELAQAILDAGGEYFMVSGIQIDGSLRTYVENLLRQHRDDYERLHGTAARQLLDQAIRERDRLGIEEVVRRFSMTEAGRDALELLVRSSRNRGEPGRASQHARHLAGHPLTQDAASVWRLAAELAFMEGASGAARVVLEDAKSLTPTEIDEILRRLSATETPIRPAVEIGRADWLNPFGHGDQSAHALPAPARGSIAWTAPLIDNHDFPQTISSPEVMSRLLQGALDVHQAALRQIRKIEDRVVFPAGRPLIVGNEVIVAGPGTFKSFDLATGSVRWVSEPLDEAFPHLFVSNESVEKPGDAYRAEMSQVVATVRGFLDRTFGSISTDGKYMYGVTDCQCVGTVGLSRVLQNRLRHPLIPQRTNRLVQLSLAGEGLYRGSLGTPSESGARFFGEESERSIFFLGAPLPVDGVLYALGEEQGQIQLFEIDPETFSVTWSLGLLNPDQDITLSETRRMSGLTPTHAGGLLICPTGEGVLCAVDPVRRQLVWTHQYRLPIDARSQMLLNRRFMMQQNQLLKSVEQMLNEDRWFDSRLMASGNHLVFTPPDHDALVVLNLRQGTPAWSRELPREHWCSLAGIRNDTLILLGSREITAVRLSDGSPAWKESVPIPLPSGRGVRMGDQYLQPLSTKEIAVVDLSKGKLLARIPFPGEEPPGNLIAGAGRLISQTTTGLTALIGRSDLERALAAITDPENASPESLEMLGSWQIQQGDFNAGVDSLRRGLKQGGAPSTRRILASALIDGLRSDFASFRNATGEIETLLQDDDERRRFFKTLALGLMAAGETEEALERLLNLLDSLPADGGELRDAESGRTVTDRQWVLARLEDMMDPAHARHSECRKSFDRWLTTPGRSTSASRVLNALPAEWFPAELIFATASAAAAEEGTISEAESLLLGLIRSPDPRTRARAMAELAQLNLRGGDAEFAERLLDELLRSAADVSISEGLNGERFVRSIRADGQWKAAFNGVPHWPRTVTPAADQETHSVLQNLQRSIGVQIPVVGPVSPALDGWTFHLSPPGNEVEIHNGSGSLQAKVKTGIEQTQGTLGAGIARHVETLGHRAMIVLMDRVLIVDLRRSSAGESRVTVNRYLITENDSPYSNRVFTSPPTRMQLGMRSYLASTAVNTYVGNVGPLTDSVVCFGIGNELVAVDPRNGDLLWKRRDLIQGSEIFGDERFIAVKPPGEDLLNVYRAADGEFVRSVPVPSFAIRRHVSREMGDWGRMIPCVSDLMGTFRWSLFDPAADRTVWELELPSETVWTTVNGFDLAFLTPEGRLSFRSGEDGREFLHVDIPPGDKSVRQLTVIEYPDQYLALTGTAARNFSHFESFGVPVSDQVRRLVDGAMVSIDRGSGEVRWNKPVGAQEVLTQYPKKWPILLMARIVSGRKIDATVIHRHTGETVWRETPTADETGAGIVWIGETQPMRIRLRIGKGAVVLDCRDSLNPGN